MTKHSILCLLLLFSPLAMSWAQEAAEAPAPRRLTLGVAGGTDNNTLDVEVAYATDYRYDARAGFCAALTGRYDLALPLSQRSFFIPDVALRADLALVQKNYKFYRTAERVDFLYTAHTNNYLCLPLMGELSWGRVFHVKLFGGAYVGAWLTGHVEGKSFSLDYLDYGFTEGLEFDEPMTFVAKRDNRFDAGWVYGCGVGASLGRVELSAEVRWYYALTDIQKHYMLFQNPRYNTTFALTAGVGYKF